MPALNTLVKESTPNKSASAFMLLLLICQPFLDVLSYFLTELDKTAYTTGLRMVMFVGIMLYAFAVSEKKKAYFVFATLAGVYFVLHAVNCFRIGYISLFDDVANFLRTVQTPALTLAFITLLKRTEKPGRIIETAFLVNIAVVWGVIGLSYLVGKPVYTYNSLKIGLMGWFGVHNAQSAIVMILVPLALILAYNVGKLLFACAAFAGFAILFLTGTQLTFYSLFIIAAAFVILLFINFFTFDGSRKAFVKKSFFPAVCVVVAVALSLIFIDESPMYQRLSTQDYAYGNHQAQIDQELNTISSNKVSSTSSENPSSDGKDDAPPEPDGDINGLSLAEYELLYRDIGDDFLGDLIDTYGISRVAKAYDHATDSYTRLNARQKKQIFAELAWEDSDLLTKCFGYEYRTLVTDREIYDLENDFPSVFYYSGYIGFALYIAFLLYFVVLAVRMLFTDFKKLFELESGMLCVTAALLLGAAQFSGNVLRRPNVSIYLSLVLAYMYITYGKNDCNKENTDV